MKTDSRTIMSKRNIMVSIAGRIVTMLTSFVGRSIFVSCLNGEYLGLGGFFGNIFSVVSLCELGLGTAISQSLYKPLATRDELKISAILRYFKKTYTVIAFVTLSLSVAALPILPTIVKSEIDYKIILAAYLLFSAHTFVSYVLAPKRMLVVCDQRMYVVTAIRSVFSVLALVIQSAVLVKTGSYVLYLGTRILVLTVEDIIINSYADKRYPFLQLKARVDGEYKKGLYSNVKALLWHKIGGTVSRSTDSILVSYFVGLSGMGKFSNYALVVGTFAAFFDIVINATTASVGNLGAFDRGKKSEQVMRKMYFINFWLLTVGTSVVVCTLNPFIALWLGKDMLFTNAEMLVIVSSFYFSCIRDPVQIFVSTYGLFKESRHIPVLRALFNLVLSVLFVVKMGVSGVFLGTLLSTVLVPLCGEVKVLYKYAFSLDEREFYKEMFGYIAISALCISVSFLMTMGMKTTFSAIAARAVCGFCTANVLLLIFASHKPYFDSFVVLLKRMSVKKRKSVS